MPARSVYDRPPRCAAQPGCSERASGMVATAARAVTACQHHGEACAERGMRWTPIPRWQEHQHSDSQEVAA